MEFSHVCKDQNKSDVKMQLSYMNPTATVASVGGRNSQGDSEINQLSNLTKIFRLGEAPALGQHDSFTRAPFIFWARL